MADAGGGSPVPPSGPVLNVAYRCKEACGIKAGPMQNSDGSHSVGADDLFVLPPNTKEIVYSGNGSLFLTLLEDSVVVWSCETFQLLSSISRRGIVAAAFSPLGTFIQTWEKVSEASTSAGGNLQIWLAATGQRVGALNVGAVFSKENWPVLQWSRDEAVAARMAPDSVIFFDGTAIDRGVVRSVSVPSITRFSLSPALPYRFATFVPEKKGNPSRFSIFDYPSCDAPICSKTHFRASYADFFWNSKGDSLLVKTSVDVDVTGQSYYGGSDIFFMNVAGTASMLAGVESPVYDCAWDPRGRYVFVLIFYMHVFLIPIAASLSLCSATCRQKPSSSTVKRVLYLTLELEVEIVSFFLLMAAFLCSPVLGMLQGQWSFGTKTRRSSSAPPPFPPLAPLVGALAPDILYALLSGPDFGSIMVTMSSSTTGPLCSATATPPSSMQFLFVPLLQEFIPTAPHPPLLVPVWAVQPLQLQWQSPRLTCHRICEASRPRPFKSSTTMSRPKKSIPLFRCPSASVLFPSHVPMLMLVI